MAKRKVTAKDELLELAQALVKECDDNGVRFGAPEQLARAIVAKYTSKQPAKKGA